MQLTLLASVLSNNSPPEEVEMTKKVRKHRRTRPRRQLALAPLRVEVTTEEILADLRYPASRRPLS
jgi:hypothetical protein